MLFQVDHKRFYNPHTLVQLYILVHGVGVVQNVHLASPKIYIRSFTALAGYIESTSLMTARGTSLSNTRRKLSERIFCILASRRMLYVDVVNLQCTIIVI